MILNKWFISYRLTACNFLTQELQEAKYGAVVTNVTPAQWIREHNADYHIQYAEKISLGLASELVHGGAGVPAEYYDQTIDY